MEKQPSAEVSLSSVIQLLRVPEFNYSTNTSSDQDAKIKRFIDAFRVAPSSCNDQTIVKRIKSDLNDSALPAHFFNSAFFCDRIFDVWMRKSEFDSELGAMLSKWRFPIFAKLYLENTFADTPEWLSLFDSIDQFAFSWSGANPRARKLVLDLFTELELGLFSTTPLSDQILSTIYQRLHTFLAQQQQRKEKVLARLVESEAKVATQRYVSARSTSKLNEIFENRTIPVSLQHLIDEIWSDVLQKSYESESEENVEDVVLLSKQIVAVFCLKGERAFQLGPGLREKIQELALKFLASVNEDFIDALEADVVSLLKGEAIEEATYKKFDVKPLSDLLEDTDLSVNQGEIYLNEDGTRLEVAAVYESQQQVLMTNDIGVKAALMSFSSLKAKISDRSLKRLAKAESFSEVYKGAVKGLEKIAENQHKARELAAEKARREAENLQRQKEEAAQHFQKMASDIAEKARNMQLKREEQEALKKKEIYLEQLASMNLGAWVSIAKDNEDKSRFKLAVKFAATGRYIFVDRLGLKKVEFKEEDLIRELSAGRVEILSDGADFDANLERVVSRLRMSKQ